MATAPEILADLRRKLAARFPTAPRVAARALRTGLAAVDDVTGGLPLGAITEIVCAAPSCGSHLLLEQLLIATRATCMRVALVDSADSFDPASYSVDLLAHLVWVRCTCATALAATDLLVRDANLGLVVLDLRREAQAELSRTPATIWYRLQRAVTPTDLSLVVFTPCVLVPSAQMRFRLDATHLAETFQAERPVLAGALVPSLQRQRLTTHVAVA